VPLKECLDDHHDQAYCVYPWHMYRYIKAPLFVIESLNDAYTYRYLWDMDCLAQSDEKEPIDFMPCLRNDSNIETAIKVRDKTIDTLQKIAAFRR